MSETEEKKKEEKPEAKTTVEASELRYLEPEKLHFQCHGAELRLTIEAEKSVPRVSVTRCFPLSDPCRFLSVRDGKGDEVGIIAEPQKLAADGRALVEEELRRRYLIPVIERIVTCKERFGTVEWEAQTDRGRRSFTTRNLREGQVTPAPNRYIISDVDGNRYDIPDLGQLDAASQAMLLQYL